MNLNPIVLSSPIFFILIGIELVVERLSHRKLYRLPDAIANLGCGITSQLSGLFMRVLAIGVYEVVYANFVVDELSEQLAAMLWTTAQVEDRLHHQCRRPRHAPHSALPLDST